MKKKDDKKGALELSVNTIVIVVIGVTLLTLGLVFVKNMFGQLTDLSGNIFDTADTELGQMHHETKFTCPTEVGVEAGKRETFPIYVGHDGTCGEGEKEFTLELTPAEGVNFDETKVKAALISPKTINLGEGQEATYTIQVAATRDAELSAGQLEEPAYSVAVLCDGKNYANGGFIVNVEKGSGIFG